MSNSTDRQLAIVSYHESGHAVVALALGHDVVYATVRPDPVARTLGHVKLGRSSSRGVRYFEELGVIMAAGPVAQRIFAPRSPVRDFGQGDRTWIGDHGAVLYASGDSPLAGSDAVRPFERRCARAARAIVLSKWWAVHKVAQELVQHRSLSGVAIADVIANADHEWSQLRAYHPGLDSIEVMRLEARRQRPQPTLSRRHIADALLRATARGAHNVHDALLADLAGRGFDPVQVDGLWGHITNLRKAA